ncbi:MAG: type II toxin-antitoxin system CcdA family antitoxin [Candidatus Bathyarchaeota archaeon]|nr:type II toxin-antitoxin system CcdA family antitoxin [Candidatus Bathyarchaeota archaeon]
MAQYETLSTKVPAELKAKIKRHGINASRVMRKSLEKEVARAEAEEIDARLEKLAAALDRIDIDTATAGIREDRDRR